MILTIKRFSDNKTATLGLLLINGKFECFTVEDEKRKTKIMGETRIPEGKYEIKYRTEGTHHTKYKAKYGNKHYGMLWLQDVPNFQYILIHIGNTEKDTDGCILIGDTAKVNYIIADSTIAYERVYTKVATALNSGEKVDIEILDIEV